MKITSVSGDSGTSTKSEGVLDIKWKVIYKEGGN
jgi:hypothetical protein|tara:strand:+ start:2221 stop:2322 length:102 start_codon:yes stop_codon:yes gene_type:complete